MRFSPGEPSRVQPTGNGRESEIGEHHVGESAMFEAADLPAPPTLSPAVTDITRSDVILQRAPEEPSPDPSTSTVPAASSSEGSGDGQEKPGQTDPHAALDELAWKLYDRIRYRLKAELRLDRERAGMVTDMKR